MVEFGLAIDAHNERSDHKLKLAAWHAANTMQPHVKKRVTMKMLMGHSSPTFRTKADAQRHFRRRNEELAEEKARARRGA